MRGQHVFSTFCETNVYDNVKRQRKGLRTSSKAAQLHRIYRRVLQCRTRRIALASVRPGRLYGLDVHGGTRRRGTLDNPIAASVRRHARRILYGRKCI